MTSLAVAELRARWDVWAWTVLVAVVGTACSGGVVIATSTATGAVAAAPDRHAAEGLDALGGTLILWTVTAAAAVIGATTSLALGSQSRQHALWVVLGVPRARVRRVLRLQLVTIGVIGALVSFPLALLTAEVTLRQFAAVDLVAPGTSPHLRWWHLPVAVAIGVVACLWGGWGATRRASREPEVSALREATLPPARTGWVKIVVAAGCAALGVGTCVAAATGGLRGAEDRAAGVVSANLLLVTAALLVGRWTLRPLLIAWTALVPDRDVAWHLARESCRARSAQSITTVVPFALALSMLGVFLGAGNVFGGEVSTAELFTMLGWVLLVSWTGGVAVIALVGRQRGIDTALIQVTGARSAVVARATFYEGTVYALTAVLFGLVATVVAVTSTALAGEVPVPLALSRAPWPLLTTAAAATLATTCLTVAAPAWRGRNVPVVDVLRS